MPKTVPSDVSAENLETTCGAGPRGPDTAPAPKPRRTNLDDIPDDHLADYGLGAVSRRESRRRAQRGKDK